MALNQVVRGGLLLLAVSAALASCTREPESPSVVPPPPPHDVFLTNDVVIGCYEVTSFEWDDPKARSALDYTLPKRFRLARDHTIASLAPSPFGMTHWRIRIDNELEATWSTGFTSLTIAVRQRSTTGLFRGRVTPGSDTGPPPWRGMIELRKFDCK